jgi:aspartyl protease family protein
MNTRVVALIVGAIGVGGLIIYLVDRFPGALDSNADQASLVRALIILLLVASFVVMSPRLNLKGALRNIVIWLGIGALILTVYTLREDFMQIGERVTGEVMPFQASENANGGLVLKRAQDGHFHIEVRVNGEPIRFLVDTGASIVTLSEDDARRAGYDPSTLDYTLQFSTANGTAWGAPIRIDQMRAGPLIARDVRAAVGGAGMSKSLLGMSFLDQLNGFSVTGDTLTLMR